MIDIIKNIFDKHKRLLLLLFSIISFSFIILLIADQHYNTFDLLDAGKGVPNHYYSIEAFHTIEVIILTLFLIMVAWIQLESLNKTSKSDFIMRIDERFSSIEIIKARVFIHELYIVHRPSCDHNNPPCKDCRDTRMQKIRDSIKDITYQKGYADIFVKLRHLLELFETLGYFVNRKYIDLEDAKNLASGTIKFHYEVFRDWIGYLQKSRDEKYFTEFEALIFKIDSTLIPEERKKKYNNYK